ncbi:MAG TPA: UDP-N-acetylmuramyl-tripeptide synthetase [Polyangiaceae bacterium]|nr:UDP-N-acetylmuramyl-tripeptide synthetase [Polyangiaceae bacterium]
MRVVCITGTNGKTTTTSMVAAVAAAAGLTPARITTVGSWVGDEPIATEVSIEAYEATLRRASERGADAFAIEVTSQALAAGFAPPWPVDVAVFTNLTHDHLDYHGTMEAYLAAKARLFVGLGPSAAAVLNAADEASALLDEIMAPGVRRLWYAARPVDPACAGAELTLRAAALRPHRAGTHVDLAPSPLADALGGALQTPLVGAPFAENALAAACAGRALGLEPAAIGRGLAAMAPVAGRFEIVIERPLVIVDYAHTPDALGHVLRTARGLVAGEGGRVACVFGCGGGRDAEKRPVMGRVAADLADLVLVTTDNPRHEDPAAIADAVETGARGGPAELRRELDRAAAIGRALAWAEPRDAIVIAGKGHERQQELGEGALPFDDGEVARRAHRALP